MRADDAGGGGLAHGGRARVAQVRLCNRRLTGSFSRIAVGRDSLDVRRVQVIDFESPVRSVFIEPGSGLAHVLLGGGKHVRLDSDGKVVALSKFRDVHAAFFDRWGDSDSTATCGKWRVTTRCLWFRASRTKSVGRRPG